MTIEEVVETNLSGITADGKPFEFLHGPKAHLNVKADNLKNKNIAWLAYPIKSIDALLATGYIEAAYPVQILFACKSRLDMSQDQQKELIALMRTAARKFLINCQNDKDNVRSVKNSERLNVQNLTDTCVSGCYLTVTITPFDESSVCP